MLSSYRIPKLLLPFAVSAALLAPPMLELFKPARFQFRMVGRRLRLSPLRSPYAAVVVAAVVFVAAAVAVSIVAVSRAVEASIAGLLVVASIVASLAGAFIAGLLVVVFIAAPLPGRSSVAVTMAASTMVIDVATGMVAGGPMVSVRAGG